MNQAEWPVSNLTTSLLRAFNELPEVGKQYLETWSDIDRPLEVRFCVIYPLLDYPDLGQATHEEFFADIMENMEAFKAFALTYFPTPEDVLPTAKKRIVDTRYPRSKRWVYLCNALASPDLLGARDFMKSYANDPDEFVAKVARTLLQQAFGEQFR